MAEYIDIEPLRKQIVEFKTAVKQFAKSSSFLKAYISGIDAVMEAIDKLPIADVQEVRHGKWETIIDADGQIEGWLHKKCGRQVTSKDEYCPNCGARMDGDPNA